MTALTKKNNEPPTKVSAESGADTAQHATVTAVNFKIWPHRQAVFVSGKAITTHYMKLS